MYNLMIAILFIILLGFSLIFSRKSNLSLEVIIPLFLAITSIPFIHLVSIPSRLLGVPVQYIPLIIWGVFNILKFFFSSKMALYKDIKWVYMFGLLFLVYGTISIFWVNVKLSWLVYISQWYIYILGILLLTPCVVKDRPKIHRFLKNYIIALTFASLMGLVNYFILGNPDSNPFLLINRNGSVFIYVPMIAVLLSSSIYFNKYSYWFIVSINLINLTLIFSRTGYLAIIITIALYLLINRISVYKYVSRGVSILIILLLVVLISNQISEGELFNIISDRFSSILNAVNFIQRDVEAVGGDWRRAALISESFKIFRENFLIGTGIGLENYLHYFTSFVSSKGPARAHSVYISYLAELGLIGYPILIALLISITAYLYKTTKLASNYNDEKLAKAIYIGNIALLIAFATGEHITSPFVWLFWGIGLAYGRTLRRELMNI